MENIVTFDFDHLVSSPFHVVDRYCDISWNVPPAPRDFHNFMFVMSGEGTSLTDGREHLMHEGMLIYQYPGKTFGYSTSKTKLMHVFGINFYLASASCNAGNWVLEPVDKLPFDNFIPICDMDIMTKLFKDITEIWSEGMKNHKLKCQGIMLNIFNEISRQSLILKSNINTLQSIEHIITYIRKNYMENISLESLALQVGLNPSYMGNIFRKYTGNSPIDYLNSVRVHMAENLLVAGLSVSETSYKVGFNDPFYFSKVFKKYKGVCPRAYKRDPLYYC